MVLFLSALILIIAFDGLLQWAEGWKGNPPSPPTPQRA